MLQGIQPHAETKGAQTPVGAQKSLGKDDFMKLLVAQLSNQNPLKPLDGKDFSAQLAQFSALEQMTNVNSSIQKLIDSQQQATNSAMINMIGKQVDVQGNAIPHKSGQTHNLSYSLSGRAANVTVEVYDQLGQLVRTLSGTGSQGNNTVLWQGQNNAGNPLPEGNYTFRVNAVDASGNSVESKTFTKGTVSEVLFEDDNTFAIVNGEKISAQEISRVSLQ